MTSKEVYCYIKQDKISDLYKVFAKSFAWLDGWAEKMICGDLLDENELAYMLDKSTGIFAKLCPVVGALESYVERVINNEESSYYNKQEKVKSVDPAIAKSNSRAKVSDVRDYLADFKGYLTASQQMICSSQSRIKRLVVEKGAKGVGYTGERPVDNTEDEEGDWNE
jgi:hypothetical protein